ncbi:MAG: thioredoxin-disulfide reductase [Saccharofermentans sp.]|jgi:thioredoxin reductase (NADPH)|nr:thioredoxin-disulfide reductase [Clostridiales bacterium]MBP3809242.1 thioredoxin-disulfide reductase [Clostridiales bacterium]MCR5047796.1 thioredoxin-disulfide reductase [Saccharofermentans sp.]
MTDVAIIGAGTAGLTAAVYARRAGASVTIFEGEAPGGQIINTPEIDNFPGLPGVSGYEYANKLFEQAQAFGAEFVFDKVKKVEGSLEEGFVLTTEYGTVCEAKTIIIASGVKRREMGLAGEQEYTGRGISYCATCDGAFFKGKTAAVFGGGNTAVEDAAYLANICKKVYIIHRRNEFRANKALVDEMLAHDNVETKLSFTVSAIHGDDKLTGVTLTSVDGHDEELPTDALFVAIGLIPENGVFLQLVDLDDAGYVIADETCETSTPGVFAAGDCRTKDVRQLVTAAADGAVAAVAASRLSRGG